jgi:hypothetical protein
MLKTEVIDVSVQHVEHDVPVRVGHRAQAEHIILSYGARESL